MVSEVVFEDGYNGTKGDEVEGEWVRYVKTIHVAGYDGTKCDEVEGEWVRYVKIIPVAGYNGTKCDEVEAGSPASYQTPFLVAIVVGAVMVLTLVFLLIVCRRPGCVELF